MLSPLSTWLIVCSRPPTGRAYRGVATHKAHCAYGLCAYVVYVIQGWVSSPICARHMSLIPAGLLALAYMRRAYYLYPNTQGVLCVLPYGIHHTHSVYMHNVHCVYVSPPHELIACSLWARHWELPTALDTA